MLGCVENKNKTPKIDKRICLFFSPLLFAPDFSFPIEKLQENQHPGSLSVWPIKKINYSETLGYA